MLSKFNIVGPSYQYSSLNFDAQRAVNVYPIQSESGTSKGIAALAGTPGLKLFSALPAGPVRGSYAANGRAFFVGGGTLYEALSDGSSKAIGALNSFSGAVSMAHNGVQLCLVDGQNGYIYKLSDSTFVRITADGFYGADTVTYVDGYFIFNRPNTGQFYISGLYDGTSEDPLDFASAEGNPDNIIGVIELHKDIWVFGASSVEVFYNSGAADFPFERISGVFIEYGCCAPGSIAKTANTVFWLGGDEDGQGIVWMATGYQPQRISTAPIEKALQGSDMSKAVAYTYQEEGHYFYVLNCADITWVYDIGLKQWHERAYFSKGQYGRHRGQNHVYAFGKHLVGDYANGNIYQQSLNIYDDNGQARRWMRTCPHLSDALQYIYYNSFQVDMQTGIGLNDGAEQDVTPKIMLRWSDDGGYTWSNEHWRDAGKIGRYKTRARWSRLGRSRDRIFEISGTMNCPVFIISGVADIEQGAN